MGAAVLAANGAAHEFAALTNPAGILFADTKEL